MHYDVFNGDADGIIALLQLRLAQPKVSQLVTGVKRDIQLLERLSIQQTDSLTVLDISMSRNSQALQKALQSGAHIFYADHHQSGDIPNYANLDAHINLDANMCTALIVDQLLQGRFHRWAIVAAYGDNLVERANQLAQEAGLSREQAEQLQELGTLINYNGYGESLEDLHFHPAELYQQLLAYDDPIAVIAAPNSPYSVLQQAYRQDISQAQSLPPIYQDDFLAVYQLPNSPESRRVSGAYGNWLANQNPHRAHLVLTENSLNGFTVSLRAPLDNKQGAGELCSLFASGGGREAAGGINHLPTDKRQSLIRKVSDYYRV